MGVSFSDRLDNRGPGLLYTLYACLTSYACLTFSGIHKPNWYVCMGDLSAEQKKLYNRASCPTSRHRGVKPYCSYTRTRGKRYGVRVHPLGDDCGRRIGPDLK